MPDLHDRLTDALRALQVADRALDPVVELLDDDTLNAVEEAGVDIAPALNALVGRMGDILLVLAVAERLTRPQTDLVALANRLVGPREVA